MQACLLLCSIINSILVDGKETVASEAVNERSRAVFGKCSTFFCVVLNVILYLQFRWQSDGNE